MNTPPKILSNKKFSENTYTLVHTNTTLQLDEKDKEKIEINWKQFLQQTQEKGIKQWDGTYYRMENTQDILKGTKELKLSTIKYSQVRGIKNDNELLNKIPVYNIATASLIKTTDNYYIFGIRNRNTVSKTKTDLIGGGLQESKLIVNTFSDVFKNMKKEIQEETGITEKDITNIQGIGIVESNSSSILLIFSTELNNSKEEVKEIFSKNIDDEMEDLEYIQRDMLKEYLAEKENYYSLIADLID